jgi:anaerobic magnesium-protoporphyrin IX monomethyl ester cyclase
MPYGGVPDEFPQRTLAEQFDGSAHEAVDVLLCQPALTLRIAEAEQDPVVSAYFASQARAGGELAGDDPWEANTGILMLGHHLVSAGLTVGYLDFHSLDLHNRRQTGQPLSSNRIAEILASRRYRVLAISAMAVAEGQMGELARASKSSNPSAVVVVGGLLPSAVPDVIRCRYPQIDHVIVGDGRPELLRVAQHATGRSLLSSPISNGKSYGLLSADVRLIPRITVTAGCHAACAFCSPIRLRTLPADDQAGLRAVDAAFDELDQLQDRFSFEFFLVGNLSFLGPQNAGDWEFCRRLTCHPKGPFWCQMRPDDVTEETVDLLATASCFQVAVGIETPNWASTRRHGKAYYRSRLPPGEYPEQVLRLIKSRGMSTYAYFMIGMPGEDLSDVELTISLIDSLLANGSLDAAHISIPVPYPGTPWYRTPTAYGLRILTHDFSQYWMNSDPLGYGDPVFETEMLSATELGDAWRRALATATKQFIRRPNRLLGSRRFNISSGSIHASL